MSDSEERIAPDVADEQLAATARKYQSLMEAAPDAIFLADVETGEILEANAAAAELLGRPVEEIVGTNQRSLHPPENGERYRELFERHVSGEERVIGRLRDGSPVEVVRDDGTRVPVEISANAISLGERTLVQGIFRDVSERRERERELEAQRAKYRSLIETAPDAIFVADAATGEIVETNAAACALVGRPREELIGMDQADLHPPEEADRYRELFRDPPAEPDGRYERFPDGDDIVVRTADGRNVPIEINATVIELDDRSLVYSVFRDVSAHRERERALRLRNEQLEEFAGVVAHDLRNPLNVATLSADLLPEDAPGVEQLDSALSRMETIIDDVLALAKQGRTVREPVPVDVQTVARRAWNMTETGAAELHADEEVEVSADPDRLQTLFENLFRNAVTHAGEAPSVWVGGVDGGFFVEDDGPGIDAEERDGVFEAGYTSERDGTGFGLAIVRRIAEAHGWSVEATVGLAGGARFEFRSAGVS